MKDAHKGIVEGLRNFIRVDNHCALKVGQLSECTRLFHVQRPKNQRWVCRRGNLGRPPGAGAKSGGS